MMWESPAVEHTTKASLKIVDGSISTTSKKPDVLPSSSQQAT
jgi:hypothetical protein